MPNRIISIIIIGVILMACNLFVHADTIILKDGRKMEGFVLEEKKDSYEVRISIGTITLNKKDVAEIKQLPPEENYLIFGDQFMASQNYDAAIGQYKKALEINPEFQPAKDAIAKIEKLKAQAQEKRRAESEKKERELFAKKERVKKDFGMEIGIADGMLSALNIERDSPANVAGINPSDTIVQVDEQNSKGKSLEEILNYLLRPETASYKFTIERNVLLSRKRFEYQNRPVVGVGIFLDMDRGGLLISNVITAGPADLAGLRAKDRVIAIENNPIQGLSLDDVSELIGGGEATTVRLTIQRTVELTRK